MPLDAALPADATAPTTDLDKAAAGIPPQKPAKSAKAISPQQADDEVAQALKDKEAMVKAVQGDLDKITAQMTELQKSRPAQHLEQFKAPEKQSPFDAFGSLAMAMAFIASRKSQTPLTAALKAAAGGMNAINKGNVEDYNRALDAWKANTDFVVKQYALENEQYHDAIDIMKTDYAAGWAKLRTLTAMFDDQALKSAIDAGMGPTVMHSIDMISKRTEQAARMQDMALKAPEVQLEGSVAAALKGVIIARQSNDPAKIAKAQEALQSAASDLSTFQAAKSGTLGVGKGTPEEQATAQFRADWRSAHDGKDPSAEDLAKFHQQWGGGGTDALITDDDAKDAGKQLAAGDKSVLTNWGRGKQGPANLVKIRHYAYQALRDQGVKDPGPALAAIDAKYQGITAAERTAGTMEARIGGANIEANRMADLVLTASKKFDRTQFPDINAALNFARTHSGDPEIRAYGANINSFVNAYVRAIAPTGVSTDLVRSHSYALLNTADTPEAVEAVIGQMKLEMQAAKDAPDEMMDYFSDIIAPGSKAPAGFGETETKPDDGWSVTKVK